MVLLKYVLIKPDHRSEIAFSLAHHHKGVTVALFGGERQKSFFEDAILNLNYTDITCFTFQEYLREDTSKSLIILMDVPQTFEILDGILKKTQNQESESLLVLLQINKKYLNMIQKKIDGLTLSEMEYSPNKFVGINDKLRQFVEQNYDMNRGGFYAYGQFINLFRANLLKKIFRTEQIEVSKLARSFGFTTPPRVKEGKFLTTKARNQNKALRLKQKKQKKDKKAEQKIDQIVEVEEKQKKTLKKTKKILKK